MIGNKNKSKYKVSNNINTKAMNRKKENRDVLDIWKERIKNESKHGDKKRACDNAGTTATTYLTAMRRTKFIDLKEGEIRVLQALIDVLDSRKAAIAEILKKYAN